MVSSHKYIWKKNICLHVLYSKRLAHLFVDLHLYENISGIWFSLTQDNISNGKIFTFIFYLVSISNYWLKVRKSQLLQVEFEMGKNLLVSKLDQLYVFLVLRFYAYMCTPCIYKRPNITPSRIKRWASVC